MDEVAPPPPPPPPPFPLFSGTKDFKSSNEAFGSYIFQTTQIEAKLRENGQYGSFAIVTFDNLGKIIDVANGFRPEGMNFEDSKLNFTEEPAIFNNISRSILNAPQFKLKGSDDFQTIRVNYAFKFLKDQCIVFPLNYLDLGLPKNFDFKKIKKTN
jgi:hypothetical protein